MIVNVEQSSLGGVVVNVGRLVGIEEIIGSKVFSESRFNNTFNDFRDERKIRNRTIVRFGTVGRSRKAVQSELADYGGRIYGKGEF